MCPTKPLFYDHVAFTVKKLHNKDQQKEQYIMVLSHNCINMLLHVQDSNSV